MTTSRFGRFLHDQRGAVAATYALALPALIMVGGVGFDYGRMVSMDSELQNAADQAALAAVTQLDGEAGARVKASEAARTWISNASLMAQGADHAIAVSDAKVVFWQDKAKTDLATSDADARFVEVTVDPRALTYALTPIMGAFGPVLDARAMAGLGSAVCKVPPLFMCNPAEVNAIGADFPVSTLLGAGIKLVAGAPNVPGNFGFLDTNGGGNSTPALAMALGWDNVPADCSSVDEIGLKPGQRAVVFGAFNTRFDISENGANTCPSGGNCSAAANTRKDLVRKNQCGTNGANGWQEGSVPYRPTSATVPIAAPYPSIMGYPRDMCHAISYDGSCTYSGLGQSTIGNAAWDRDAYFRVNFGYTTPAAWQSATGLGANATRNAVYKWELADPATRMAQQNAPGGTKAYSAPVCRAAATGTDRRTVAMAVVNCRDQATKISGNDKVTVLKYVEVFLVEPAYNRGAGAAKRTTDDQVYVEVVREIKEGDGAADAQVIRRDVPYLVQ